MRSFGVIGKSLQHSFSPRYFRNKFEKLQIEDAQYEAFELSSIEQFPQLINEHPNLHGLNVTIPYKEEVMFFLDEVDENVQAIGACNCIRIRDGRIKGYNTDWFGFKQSLLPLLNDQHKRALVLGSGGASKAVCYALQQLHIPYKVVSRNGVLTYEQLDQTHMEDHTIIINTTPLGTWPRDDDFPLLPYEHITTDHLLYDLVYNPPMTTFLQKGKERGAEIKNGYEMLVLQAEESWTIWNS